MTLREIAKLANVSPSTVSRILNSKDNNFASEAVRDRVWEIVKSTGYVPNAVARNLRMNSESKLKPAKTIACILANVKAAVDNPFFAQVARAVEQQALFMECVVAYSCSIFDMDDDAVMEKIISTPVDGIVILGRMDKPMVKLIKKHKKNVVYIGVNSIEADWDQVICDGHDVADRAMRYLIEEGHKNIGYLGETKDEIRYTAYIKALTAVGIPIEKSWIINCPPRGDGGYVGADALIKNNKIMPSAVFCVNDITAISALKRFREEGLKVPRDISIIGIDDIEMAQYVSPMLTTVEIPKTELGQIAVKILIDRIDKGHKVPMKITLPHKLVIRESVSNTKKTKKGGN